MGLRLRIGFFATLVVCALALVPAGFARSADMSFDGGTRAQRAQVSAALGASSFNWRLLPDRITVHIAPGLDSEATPGNVWLDANLLSSGRFSWGVVQHEFAHQVDFLLLSDAQRTELGRLLRTTIWCDDDDPSLRHSDYGCERFASTLAWAYWPSADNVMRPHASSDEAGTVTPAAFRSTVTRMLARAER